jgi:hypothetical protein
MGSFIVFGMNRSESLSPKGLHRDDFDHDPREGNRTIDSETGKLLLRSLQGAVDQLSVAKTQ